MKQNIKQKRSNYGKQRNGSMRPQTITIKRDDVLGRNFGSTTLCPLAVVISKALNINAKVGTTTISDSDTGEHIGNIDPQFHKIDYDKLHEGFVKEFVTQFIPKDNFKYQN